MTKFGWEVKNDHSFKYDCGLDIQVWWRIVSGGKIIGNNNCFFFIDADETDKQKCVELSGMDLSEMTWRRACYERAGGKISI